MDLTQSSPKSSKELPSFDVISEAMEILPDAEARVEYLISLGRQLPPLADSEKVDSNRVWGCMASVWLTHSEDSASPGKLQFSGQSDSMLVSGIVAIVISFYAGRTAEQILALDPEEALGSLNLGSQLSTARRTGLSGMIEKIRLHAAESL